VSNRPTEVPANGTIQIVVNGETRDVPQGSNLEQLLGFLEVNPDRVAIERNLEIVRKPEWSGTQILPGDRLEVVWFVGGGSR
jgi:thiamine biosynthesis protein ThiS